MTEESLLERYDLQAAIVNSWESFCSEIGCGDLRLVGNEVIPHGSCLDSIDILAVDPDGTPVIIELKRGRNKLQLLQSITYAAMVSTWSKDELASRVKDQSIKERIISRDALPTPRVILVAESYDPEVILTANFLAGLGLSTVAIAVEMVKLGDQLLMNFSRRFPLPDLDESYVPRRSQSQSQKNSGPTWDDVQKVLEYPWAGKAISLFRKRGDGRPDRRSFGTLFRNTPIGTIREACFRLDNLHVILGGADHDSLRGLLSCEIERWGKDGDHRSGWALRIRSEDEFDEFVKVAEIG